MMRALLVALAVFGAAPGQAAEQTIAYSFTPTGAFDKTIAAAAHRGVIAARAAGAEVAEISLQSKSEEALAHAAATSAHVIAIGPVFSEDLARLAQTFPNRRFTLIDGALAQHADNLRAIRFDEAQSAFLAGALAARKSTTGELGFIGGMDSPATRRVLAGYRAGARHARPDIALRVRMAGRTPAAFGDPYEGWLIASDQLDAGADIIFADAGTTGLGACLAAAQRGAFAIATGANANALHPGVMLTSALKGIDHAVMHALTHWRDEDWQSGDIRLGLADDAVGLAFDRYNDMLLDAADRAFLARTRAAILRGEITIPAGPEG